MGEPDYPHLLAPHPRGRFATHDRPSGPSVSKALVGSFNIRAAEGLSSRTLGNYRHRLKQWAEFAGDVNVTVITLNRIHGYLSQLRTDNEPGRIEINSKPGHSFGVGASNLRIIGPCN